MGGARRGDRHADATETGEWGRAPPRTGAPARGWGQDGESEVGWREGQRAQGLDAQARGIDIDEGWRRSMSPDGAVGQNPQGSDNGDWGDGQAISTGGGRAASGAGSDGGRGAETVSSASTLGGRTEHGHSEHAAAFRDAQPHLDSPSRPVRRKGQGPETLRVPTDEHPTIGAALAAAVSGDTVSVAAGTYLESITIAAVDVDVVCPKTLHLPTSKPQTPNPKSSTLNYQP